MSGRTKIVATLGPASSDREIIGRLIDVGVDVFRLNLSHGPLAEHLGRLADIRAVAAQRDCHVAVLADLPGPKVRSGRFEDGGVMLEPGAALTLVSGEQASSATVIAVDYPSLCLDLEPGDRIVVGDGAISMRVTTVSPNEVGAVVITGGRVQGRPGIHLPAERLRLAAPTDDDLELGVAMASAGVDFLALSFVRRGDDVRRLRTHVGDACPAIVAKIETAQAVDELADIMSQADAVMVARGDLGIECPLEDVPHLQKRIVRACVEAGVPVITATQMLESMITAPAPTRAEVSDVANAVFDGSDALMLSAETAIGSDPVNVVRTMISIADRAEQGADYAQWGQRLGRVQRNRWESMPDRITSALTHAAVMAASDIDVNAILCCTRSGRTARAMARFRPLAPLIALSPDPATARRLALTWGVIPVTVQTYSSTDELVWFAVERTVQAGLVHHDDIVLVLAGSPTGPAWPAAAKGASASSSGAATDVLRVVRVA